MRAATLSLYVVIAATLSVVPMRAMAASALPVPAEDPAAFLRAAAKFLCAVEQPGPATIADALDGASIDEFRAISVRGEQVGWRATARFPQGGEIRIRRRGTNERSGPLAVDYYETAADGMLRPIMTAVTDPDCRFAHGRRLLYDKAGRYDMLERFGPDLQTVVGREPLNPPVPPGRNLPGIVIALFDAGLNYTLPKFAARLHRAPSGASMGYDFWDRDSRPFDGNPARSPFYPVRHGTRVASVLLAEAPYIRLLPYRYPRPDMRRMGDMVKAADANGAVVVSMPMGSNRVSDWATFVAAALERPHMLFVVSAGNDGRDIDAEPVYPAALDLETLLVVTSSTASGELAPRSNWGRSSVDLLIPAEDLPATDFNGRETTGSGASFAVARTAAMAARLLRRNRAGRAPDLKRAILSAAAQQPGGAEQSRHGWIAEPLKIR